MLERQLSEDRRANWMASLREPGSARGGRCHMFVYQWQYPFSFLFLLIFSNKCYMKNKDKDCSCTTMGLKEAFISSLLTLYYNICQAYTLISPYFATLARITVKFSAGLQRHLASRFCCLARMCFILLVHHLFVNLYLQMDFMSTVVM